MKRLRLAVAAAVPALAHIPTVGDTVLEKVTVTPGAGSVAVEGVVTFGGQAPQVLQEDPAGDNAGAAASAAAGADLVGVAVAQRESGSEDLTFELRLNGLRSPRAGFEALQYNWDIEVDGGVAKGGTNWSIKTSGTQARSQSPAPWAAVHTCVEGGTAGSGFTCTPTTTVEAVYDTASSTIYVNVPMSAIKARPGSTITSWARNTVPVWIGASAGGALTYPNVFDGIDEHKPFRVPAAPALEVGAAPAGTAVTAFTPVTVGEGGAFATTLPVAAPGDHDVVVRACFAGNCAQKLVTTTVTS